MPPESPSVSASALFAALSAMIVAAVLTPLVRMLALRFHWVDQGLAGRRLDGRQIPRLGGLAIVGAFCVALVALWLTGWPQALGVGATPELTVAFVLGGSCIAGLGLFDDLRGAGVGQKLTVQCAVAALLFVLGLRIEGLANPFGPTLVLGPLSFPFTMLWIVGIINAFNLIDGLDGLAGGVALIAVGTNLVIGLSRHEPTMVLIGAVLAGAISGFLFYNFNPASIFMGDTGSMFLGFVLSTLTIKVNQKSTAAVSILIPIVALGLPIFDTALAFVRRAAKGRSVFHADREHIHHQLLALGLSHRQAVLALYVLSAFLGTLAVALTYASNLQTLAILGGLTGVLFLLLSRLGYLGSGSRAPLDAEAWAPLAGLARSLDAGIAAIRRSTDPRSLWDAAREALRPFNADFSTLNWIEHESAGGRVVRSFVSNDPAPGSELLRARFALRSGARELGTLDLAWRNARPSLGPEERALLERLAQEIAAALARFETTPRSAEESVGEGQVPS
jgi:UDP-GlcNAc:undecaprenyl-phosphate/decaprenyl-phosphate GlcNAc-1-phosphate transferase